MMQFTGLTHWTELLNETFIKLLLLKNNIGLKNNIFRELLLYLKFYTIRMAQVVKLNKELFVYVHHLRNHYTKQSCILLQHRCARGIQSLTAHKTQVFILTFWKA